MSRLSISVRLEDACVQTGFWELDVDQPHSDAAQRSRLRDFLSCVGQAVVDDHPRGVYHVLRPAICAPVGADVQIRPATVQAHAGLPAGKLSVAISVAEAAANQLPAVPDHLSGTSSAIEMQWAAARLLIECAAKNLREAHALLAPYEHYDPEDLVAAEAGQ